VPRSTNYFWRLSLRAAEGFEEVELNHNDLVIDVSSHQGDIDWIKVAQVGVKAAYIRATMGVMGIDTEFKQNAQNVTIPHGFYHLFRGEYSGKGQAENLLIAVKPYRYQLPLAIDVEEIDPPHPLTPIQMADEIFNLCQALELEMGVKPTLYTRASFWNNAVASQHDNYFSQCGWWLAAYGVDSPALPRGCPTYWLHQYSSEGTILGITGRVDLNRANISTTKILNIPYLSQWDSDARLSIGDCGIVSVAMIARWKYNLISPDALLIKSGLPSGRSTYIFGELIRAGNSIGLKFKYTYPATWIEIKKDIQRGYPVIPLLDYEYLSGNQDVNFKGNHFWVVVGFDENNVIVNDPDWWGVRRSEGYKRKIPLGEFEKAIGATGNQALFLEE